MEPIDSEAETETTNEEIQKEDEIYVDIQEEEETLKTNLDGANPNQFRKYKNNHLQKRKNQKNELQLYMK